MLKIILAVYLNCKTIKKGGLIKCNDPSPKILLKNWLIIHNINRPYYIKNIIFYPNKENQIEHFAKESDAFYSESSTFMICFD